MDFVMNEKEQILQKLTKLRPEISERYKITTLELFGSFARGEGTAGSDVDLLVEFSQTPDLLTFIELEERITAELGRRVDLVPKRKLRVELAGQIVKEAVAI
jgi:predicted nucleotidyltransferase